MLILKFSTSAFRTKRPLNSMYWYMYYPPSKSLNWKRMFLYLPITRHALLLLFFFFAFKNLFARGVDFFCVSLYKNKTRKIQTDYTKYTILLEVYFFIWKTFEEQQLLPFFFYLQAYSWNPHTSSIQWVKLKTIKISGIVINSFTHLALDRVLMISVFAKGESKGR